MGKCVLGGGAVVKIGLGSKVEEGVGARVGGGIRKVEEDFVKFRVIRVGRSWRRCCGKGLHIADKLRSTPFIFEIFFVVVHKGWIFEELYFGQKTFMT